MSSKNIYELNEGAEKLKEIELALAYIKDVVVAISNLAISGDIIQEVYDHLAEIDICANNINEIIAVAGNEANINIVANDIARIITVANSIAKINIVADNIADVTIVADDISAILLVASNLQSIIDAPLKAWDAEASAMTADSYSNEFTDTTSSPANFVKVYTSNGDGTFLQTPQTDVFSAKWYGTQIDASIVPAPQFPTDEGLALVARVAGNDWEKILGLPNEQGQAGKSVTNTGVEGDGFWSPITTNPNVLTEDFTLQSGASASVVSGFTIADGITLTIPSGSVLSVV